jgi:hypothetical protein
MDVIECSGINSTTPVNVSTRSTTGPVSSLFSTTSANAVIFAGYHIIGTITGYVPTPGFTLTNPMSAFLTGNGPDRQTEYRQVSTIQTDIQVSMTGGQVMWGNWVVVFNLTGTPQTVATPVIAPTSQYYTEDFTSSITCATEGAVIHYTTNNTIPTIASPQYSSPIPISASTKVIRAKAVAEGQLDSNLSNATYLHSDISTVALVQQVYSGLFLQTATLTVTAGNFLVVFVGGYGTSTISVSDTHNNIYTPCGVQQSSGGIFGNFFWAYVTGSGTYSLTVEANIIAGYQSMSVMEFSGFRSFDPVDVAVSSAWGVTTNSITTTNAHDLILVCYHIEGNPINVSAGAGYTLLTGGMTDNTSVHKVVGYKIVTSTTTESATITTTDWVADNWIVALKID